MTSSLVGSEMCIRDRATMDWTSGFLPRVGSRVPVMPACPTRPPPPTHPCLLYTSDAADDM
eukprot:5461895-Prorocentrum_lima.AAC.1